MVDAYISLGSNMGNKEGNIKQALVKLAAAGDIGITRVSSLYSTEPVGYKDQDWFLNAVAAVATEIDPDTLLSRLLAVEDQLGRVRTVRWGPRVVDLDLLLYGNETRETERLYLPHPRMYDRAFVMAPLAEIAPDLVHPDGRTTTEILNSLTDNSEIKLLKVFS